jgi:uncharacterized protein YkwD
MRHTVRHASAPSRSAAPGGVAAASPVRSTTGVCANADLVPAAGNLATVSAATLCLINQRRAAARVGPLRANLALATAAAAHSADMVGLDYFDHVSPSGQVPIDRETAAGYGGSRGPLSLGENIAAVVDQATPDVVVAMWMRSPEHRANILDPEYRDSGMSPRFRARGAHSRSRTRLPRRPRARRCDTRWMILTGARPDPRQTPRSRRAGGGGSACWSAGEV